MANDDNPPKDITVKLPRKTHEDVGRFIETEKGKRFINESDFYREASRRLLREYETQSDIHHVGQDEFDSVILKDDDLGQIVTLSLKKNKTKGNILVCNTCDQANCPHRNFVKGYKPLWEYLKKHDLKIKNFADNF